MKIIVGLGNPGDNYKTTRHNVGFLCLDHYLKKNNITLNMDKKFNALIAISGVGDNRVIYLEPQTYMNLSGEALYKVTSFYKVEPKDILVIYDDMDLPFSSIRIRESGSAGGHNGIKNIILNMATLDIKRVRIGISGHQDIDAKDYVLGHFNKEEIERLDKTKETVSNIIDDFIKGESFQVIMQRYNYKGDQEA